ncbi:MAG: hypothetical protein ACT4R6_13190 [Gemmatimonadaceae bacterium]
MTYEPNERGEALPERVLAVLREIYAAPSAAGYWSSLEERIVGRVRRDAAVAWWSHFSGWQRAGLAAAAAAVLIAGLVWLQDVRSDQRMAREQLVQPLIDDVPVFIETMADEPSRTTREATLRYVISR